MSTTAQTLAAYYRIPDVRRRMAEYCGGASPRSFTAAGIAAFGGRLGLSEADGAPVAAARRDWSRLLEAGADVCRSLADAGGTLVLLDVDYANPADPAEPYRRPEVCFERLEPVYAAVTALLGGYGLRPLAMMTARGYHFTFRAPLDSPLRQALIEIGAPPASLLARYQQSGAVPAGRAHDGAGRLLEHLCHLVVRIVAGRSPVPVTLADLPPPGGGPFVCLDLTAYADPLFERHARCAFSANQKAGVTGVAPERPFVLCLPRGDHGLEELLAAREVPRRAAALAAETSARIPDVGSAEAWVGEYRRSRLARFHRDFERGPRMLDVAWQFSYDSLDLNSLPACAALPLAVPNPLLLRPALLRTVALALGGLGWHPRSVAGLVRSRYQQDHGWGALWRRYDPAARAEFYVRVLVGAVADGLEPGPFECPARKAGTLCEGCPHDLRALLDRLATTLREAS